jgi:hypothetical protein
MGRRTLIITFALKASLFRIGTHGWFSRGFFLLPLHPLAGLGRIREARGRVPIPAAYILPGMCPELLQISAAFSSNSQNPPPPTTSVISRAADAYMQM